MISELYNEQMGEYFAKLAKTQTNISGTAINTAIGNFPPPQIIKTNADRIRNMTDEELSELWWEFVDCGECPFRDCRMLRKDCLRLSLEWLKAEVET